MIEKAVTFAVSLNSTEMGESIGDSRLSEADERPVSVLTCQEATIADARISFTYLGNKKSEERDGELHWSWFGSGRLLGCREVRMCEDDLCCRR
jgi:hypothetical protein